MDPGHMQLVVQITGGMVLTALLGVLALAVKVGVAKKTQNGHTEDIAKLDSECQSCRAGVSDKIEKLTTSVHEVDRQVVEANTKLTMLLRHNGVVDIHRGMP